MDETSQVLKKLMDICTVRHRVLANNLANASTPGYLRKEVVFKGELSKALKKGDMGKVAGIRPEIRTDFTSPVAENGNNVASQKELGAIMENTLLYGLSVKALSGRFATMRRAIRGN